MWWLHRRYWRMPRDLHVSPVWEVALEAWMDRLEAQLDTATGVTLPVIEGAYTLQPRTAQGVGLVYLPYMAAMEGFTLVRPRRATMFRAHRLLRKCTFVRRTPQQVGVPATRFAVFRGACGAVMGDPHAGPAHPPLATSTE